MAADPWPRSACGVAEGMHRRKYSYREVMASVVGRIRVRNPALNVIVYADTEGALAEMGMSRHDERVRAVAAWLALEPGAPRGPSALA